MLNGSRRARLAAVGDQVSGAEIAEGDRQAVRSHIGHVLGLDHRITQQRRRLPLDHSRLPDEGAVAGLELADARQRVRIHHPTRALTIGCLQRMHQFDQLVLRVRRRKGAGGPRRQMLQRAEGADAVELVRRRTGQETLRPVRPVAGHERRSFRDRELAPQLLGQPVLDVEHRIVEHRLARRRIGVKLARRRHNLGKAARRGLWPRRRLADPARAHRSGRDQLAITARSRLHHRRDRPDRRQRLQRRADRAIDLARHRIAALAARRPRQALHLDPGIDPAPQISLDERIARRVGRLRPVEGQPRRGDRLRVDLAL